MNNNPIFDNDDIDWDEIDMDMLSDRDDAIEDYIDEYTDSPEFDHVVLQKWKEYRSSASFSNDFDEWCDTNEYEQDGFALECMKDEWIIDWKYDNEDDWKEENKEELEEKWKRTKEADWRRKWAEEHASYYNVSVEKILLYWKLNPIFGNPWEQNIATRNKGSTTTFIDPPINNDEKNSKKVATVIHLQIPAGKADCAPPVGAALGEAGVNIMAFCEKFNAATQNMTGVIPVEITVYQRGAFDFILQIEKNQDNSNSKIEQKGKNIMQNKIPVETFFKKASGKVTARKLADKLVLYCDLYTDNTEEDQYEIEFDFIAYDEDDDICGRYSTGMCWLKEPKNMEIISGCEPVKLIVREK